jgi:membrane protein insertase Oxa1/YidC/SpoIIIJ
LYWFVNNLVSIGQQTVTNRYMKAKNKGDESQKSVGGKSKKSRKK